MEIRRKDGTLLTDDDITKLQEKIFKSGTPLKEYEKISNLEGSFFPVEGGYIEIVKALKKENEIIFTLRTGNYIFEKNVIYPMSKVFTYRFLTFLEWQALKNIDKILER